MARLRYDNISSRGPTNPITFADGTTTTGSWSTAPAFPTIASPDYAPISVDPDTDNEEIVYLTAYTAGATSGTFSRAQEGTTGVAHSAVPWVHGPTARDFPVTYEAILTGSDILCSAGTPTNIVSLALPVGDFLIKGQIAYANPAPNGAPGNYASYATETSAGGPSTAFAGCEYQSLPAGQGFTLTFEREHTLSTAKTIYLVQYGSPYSSNVWHFGNFLDIANGTPLTSLRAQRQG